ncbi:MAG TPA: type IV pilus assembly protein PilM [Candidatus Saccharimonadia bacterium]|nr:type IV pilus assembly protein PilM [Candidatus Saccharimonadia bacterium]
MSILSGQSAFFGLDIGTSAIRLVELRGGGKIKSLVKYAYVPISSTLTQTASKADEEVLAETIKDLISKAHLSTKNVAVGIPSQKVFTTVVEVDKLTPQEMEKSIKYQADSLIPTPLADSKIDWMIIGDSATNPNKVELLLSSVPNVFTNSRLEMLESIGLNVIAFEPDNLALTRALLDPDDPAAQLVFDLGNVNSDLVINMKGSAMLTRSITFGIEAIVRSAMQNLNVNRQQAEEVVFKFGLDKTKTEGNVYQAIINAVDSLASEIDKSIKFFANKYTNVKLEKIVVAGAAAILPEFPLYLATHTNINVEIGNAWRNVDYDKSRLNELLAVSNNFGVAVGLAERAE